MNKTDVEVSLYKTHLLLIAKCAKDLNEMAIHYYTQINDLGDAEPFVYATKNLSERISQMADIDVIRQEIIETMNKPPV